MRLWKWKMIDKRKCERRIERQRLHHGFGTQTKAEIDEIADIFREKFCFLEAHFFFLEAHFPFSEAHFSFFTGALFLFQRHSFLFSEAHFPFSEAHFFLKNSIFYWSKFLVYCFTRIRNISTLNYRDKKWTFKDQ